MTPSPGAGGLGCLLVPLHLLASYSLVRYFVTPQYPENPQEKAQHSLANRVVHYEPVRRSLDSRNADEGGRAGGQRDDDRRPRDRARTVVAEEETTDESARKQLFGLSRLANSPSPPAAAAASDDAEVSLELVVADSEHIDQIETKVERGAKVEQLSAVSPPHSIESKRVRAGGGMGFATGSLYPRSSPDAATPSAIPSSSLSSSSHASQKVDPASTADSTLSSVASSAASTADSPIASTADLAAPLAKSSPPPRSATVATSANFATDVDAGSSLDFAEEEPKQPVTAATTVSPGVPVAGKMTLAAARLELPPSLDKVKRSPFFSPSTSTNEASLRSNENVVGSVVQPVYASTVDPVRKKASVAPAHLAALPNPPSPPRAAVSITSSVCGVHVGKALECAEKESKAAGKIEASKIDTGLECTARLGPLRRPSPLNETIPTKRSRSRTPSSQSWSLSTVIQFFVRVADRTLTVSARPDAPVAAIMTELSARTGIASTDFFLLFGGKVLGSDSTIADYDVRSGSQLFMCERRIGGAGNAAKRPRIEVAEIDWGLLAEEEAEWRADREDYCCEGWGDGCGGEHPHEDSDESMDGVDYSYNSSEEDEEACRPNGRCQKKPPTKKQIIAGLRERNKSLREGNEKMAKANIKYFDENERLKKEKGTLEKELERLQKATCSCTAPKLRPKAKKAAPAIVKTSDARHARLRAGRKEVNTVDDGDPLEAEFRALWEDRPVSDVFAPTPIDEAAQDLHLVDLSHAQAQNAEPDALFKLDPACVGGKASLFACTKGVNMPVRFDRQFPGYVGDAFFKVFLDIIGCCDRFLFDLFTISNDYLPTLLTCNTMVDWAFNPNASALLRCSHAVAGRLYSIVKKSNSILKARLLERGVSQSEASRPRLLIQMLRTDGCASYHSKTLTGISKDGVTLYIWDGSANPSKRGFGSTATDSAGAPVEGSSHETKPLLAVPALSVVGQRHLAELDRFELFLARQQRLLRTNEETTRPITQVKSVEQAESTLKALRKDAGIDKAEAVFNKARSSAWSQRFLEIQPLKLTRSGLEEIPSGESFSINSHSSSTTTFRPPQLFKKLFIQEGTDAKSGQWAAKKAQPGEVLEAVYLFCGDCGSVVLGRIPPSQKESFRIRHLPIGVGCPLYVSASRGILLSKSTTTQQYLEGLLQGLQDGSVVEPISGARIYTPLLVWYRSLKEDLEDHKEIRASIRRFLDPLPPNHPYRYFLTRLLDVNAHQLSCTIRTVRQTVMTARQHVYEDGKQTTSIPSGCLAEAVRFTYEKSAKSTKARVEKIPADVFWLPIDEAKRSEGDEEAAVEEEDEDEDEDEFDHS